MIRLNGGNGLPLPVHKPDMSKLNIGLTLKGDKLHAEDVINPRNENTSLKLEVLNYLPKYAAIFCQ